MKIGKLFDIDIEKDLKGLLSVLKELFHCKSKLDKTNSFILFVDDDEFPVVDNLVEAGWAVKRIEDVRNVQDEDIKRANVIFVDYKGVGKTLSETEEGIGIIKAIKESYRNSKRVILYSGHAITLGPHLKYADNQMSKESDTYEFISMITSELEKIK